MSGQASIVRSTSRGFRFTTFDCIVFVLLVPFLEFEFFAVLDIRIDEIVVDVPPSLVLAVVCTNRVCCSGTLDVMGTRLFPVYGISVGAFVILS